MKYEKPELTKLANAIDAVQSHGVKVKLVSDAPGSTLIATANAYEADE
jgi:hypothetical protein